MPKDKRESAGFGDFLGIIFAFRPIFKMMDFGEYFSPTTQKLIVNSLKSPQSINPLDQLSERELLVANLYAKGLGNLEIANQLDVKQNTISTMKKRIFDKLNIKKYIIFAVLLTFSTKVPNYTSRFFLNKYLLNKEFI